MRSIQLQEELPGHEASWTVWETTWFFLSHPVEVPWPARLWNGAWATESGHIIRAWTDDVQMDRVRVEISRYRKDPKGWVPS